MAKKDDTGLIYVDIEKIHEVRLDIREASPEKHFYEYQFSLACIPPESDRGYSSTTWEKYKNTSTVSPGFLRGFVKLANKILKTDYKQGDFIKE